MRLTRVVFLLKEKKKERKERKKEERTRIGITPANGGDRGTKKFITLL
jgi:hypothetical protein